MKKEIIEKFIKFLKKNRAYKKFINNLKNLNNDETTKDIDKYLPITGPHIYIWAAFTWDKSPEGNNYWHNLTDKWDEEISDHEECG